jgi:hypothetical protein
MPALVKLLRGRSVRLAITVAAAQVNAPTSTASEAARACVEPASASGCNTSIASPVVGGTVTIDGTEWQIEGIEAQTATLSALRLVAEGQHERTRAAYRRA